MSLEYEGVWIFNGARASLPSAAFSDLAQAEAWIREHGLSGMLTKYPLDRGLYEWAIDKGFFTPSRDYQRKARFIGQFTCASLEHYHYEDGLPD